MKQNDPLLADQVVFYQTEDGKTRLDVRLENETVWLTQSQMAELFQSTKQNISLHIKNIFDEHELAPEGTVKESLTVQNEGSRKVSRKITYYNLDIIISVGYRAKSIRGTQFRIWATQRLREYIIKGFILDDERLKNPKSWDYFDELLERIREIRASEKRFYQKIRDIYATSIDYMPKSTEAQLFFKTVQNKILWAVLHKTAAELIAERANASLPNMGLTTWQGQRVRKIDVTTAKNYLTLEEADELNRLVNMFLDFAEDQAKRRQAMTMKKWEERLDAFLNFNERQVLTHAGSISHDSAEKIAHKHFETFDIRRRETEKQEAETEHMEEMKALEKEIFSLKAKEE